MANIDAVTHVDPATELLEATNDEPRASYPGPGDGSAAVSGFATDVNGNDLNSDVDVSEYHRLTLVSGQEVTPTRGTTPGTTTYLTTTFTPEVGEPAIASGDVLNSGLLSFDLRGDVDVAGQPKLKFRFYNYTVPVTDWYSMDITGSVNDGTLDPTNSAWVDQFRSFTFYDSPAVGSLDGLKLMVVCGNVVTNIVTPPYGWFHDQIIDILYLHAVFSFVEAQPLGGWGIPIAGPAS